LEKLRIIYWNATLKQESQIINGSRTLRNLSYLAKNITYPLFQTYLTENIITYIIGTRPTYSLVSEMLEKALERLPEEHQLLMHSLPKLPR
jgi:hypothetical protein